MRFRKRIAELEKKIKEMREKITWLSEENATLHTQVDDDALKRANNTKVLRDMLENKKQNAEKHLAELVDDFQIDVRFIEACKKQIEDARRQLKKLDGEESEPCRTKALLDNMERMKEAKRMVER